MPPEGVALVEKTRVLVAAWLLYEKTMIGNSTIAIRSALAIKPTEAKCIHLQDVSPKKQKGRVGNHFTFKFSSSLKLDDFQSKGCNKVR